MAIIQCPACKERISDKAATCIHCGVSLNAHSDNAEFSDEQLASQVKMRRLKKRYSLQQQAILGVLLFLFSIFIWYFVGKQGLSKPSHFIQLGLAAVGGGWYLITRVRIIQFNKK